jgi:hypothetical protein
MVKFHGALWDEITQCKHYLPWNLTIFACNTISPSRIYLKLAAHVIAEVLRRRV